MQLFIYAVLTTLQKEGSLRGTINLFEMNITTEVTTLLIASRETTQDIKTDKGTFRVPLLTATSKDMLVGHHSDSLTPQEASSSEYVRNLIKQGWVPIKKNWIAAASEGYHFPKDI